MVNNNNNNNFSSLHPGVVRTELVREIVGNPILNLLFKLVTPIYFIFTKSCL